jgi:hypothetical protein
MCIFVYYQIEVDKQGQRGKNIAGPRSDRTHVACGFAHHRARERARNRRASFDYACLRGTTAGSPVAGPADLDRILLDIDDGPLDIVARIEKDLPAGAAPHRMIARPEPGRDDVFPAAGLQLLDHLLGLVAMLANDDVNMIRHGGEGVAGVTFLADDLHEAAGDDVHLVVREVPYLVLQLLLGVRVESQERFSRRTFLRP